MTGNNAMNTNCRRPLRLHPRNRPGHQRLADYICIALLLPYAVRDASRGHQHTNHSIRCLDGRFLCVRARYENGHGDRAADVYRRADRTEGFRYHCLFSPKTTPCAPPQRRRVSNKFQ